ncbi:MAG: rRNA maturation RNase YbeY [Micavibrio sp.]|nr:rRNA maturation RNase YbeY [Micavibrio sp.]HCK32214.1 rRNA maturation RNase YbeY [Rhodospirillaceae bacterium]
MAHNGTYTPLYDIIDAPDSLDRVALERALIYILQDLEEKPCLFTIKFTDDTEIQQLNKDFRGKDKPTNVLSFPNDSEDYLGDIAISIDTIKREAEEQGKPYEHHTLHMIIHGFLHLLGFDHIDDDEAEEMESFEIAVLQEIGIKNPYI